MERIQHFKIIFSLCFLALIIFASKDVYSQEILKINIPLSKVTPVSTTTLMGMANHMKMKIPIPDRWQINKAVLNFSYINSTALLQNRSRLVVWLNEHPIAQITLNPQLPQGKASINLPVNLLKSGYNELNFTVAHHFTNECEDPSSPELWTTLEFDKATLDFEISLKKVPENLSSIANFLFDSKMFGKNEVNLVVNNKKEETIELASMVASAIALKFEYRPVNFQISEKVKKGIDNIIIGESEFIRETIGDSIQEKGSIIKIIAPKDDPYYAYIILKGDNYEELRKSVLAFSSINFPFPQVQYMKIDNINLVPKNAPAGRGVLLPGYEYSFRDLNFFNTNFRGVGAKSTTLDFRLPSYVFLKPNSFISLKLNFSYGSGMRKDSSLNLQINGKYVASIHLDNIKGGLIRNYIIDLPLSLFKPGYNLITFTAVLSPLITGYCEFVQTENLQLTIFEDSKLSLPNMPSWTEMPNLSLFFTDAFPFSKPADFSNTGLFITDQDNKTLSAAINLVALSAQRAGYVPFGIKVSYDIKKLKNKNILLVGSYEKTPKDFLNSAGIQIQQGGSFIYYLVKHFEKGETSLNSKFRAFIEKFLPIFKSMSEFVFTKSSINFSGKQDGKWTVLSEFESPYESRKTSIIFTASDEESLIKGVDPLWEPSFTAKVGGALTIFDPQNPEETVSSYYTDRVYYVGNMGIFSGLYAWIYAHPMAFTILMIILITILAYFIYRALQSFKRKRLNESEK